MCTAPATFRHIVHTNLALKVDTLLKRFEHLSLRCLQHVIGLDSHYTSLEEILLCGAWEASEWAQVSIAHATARCWGTSVGFPLIPAGCCSCKGMPVVQQRPRGGLLINSAGITHYGSSCVGS